MSDRDTQDESLRRHFSATRWSRALAVGVPLDAELVNSFAASYWREVYLWLRRDRGLSNEEAKDLTQAFFVHLVEDRVLEKFSAAQGRLRTFLKASLANFATDRYRRAQAQRRGGGLVHVSFDAMEVGRLDELARGTETPDALFDREWRLNTLRSAMQAVQKRCEESGRSAYWVVYEMHDVNPGPDGPPTYRALGERLGLSEQEVTRVLASVRREVRLEVMRQVSEQVAAEGDLHEELRDLLGE